MPTFDEVYLSVLRNERENLLTNYFDPHQEGTGHFNTAASVLEMRIKEIENIIEKKIHNV
jgi:hypothetical protein